MKAGRQITAVKAMLDRLTSGHTQQATAAGEADAPSGLIVNDVSDTGAAIAWKPVAGAQKYAIDRTSNGGDGFTSIGSVSGTSFGDFGLRPATSYRYKVTVTLNDGAEGPSLPVVTATTLSAAPRCNTPGSCRVR